MREIRFRAWDGKKLQKVRQIQFDADGHTVFWCPCENYPNRFYQNCEKYPLMQYTGLKDKNGKEGYFDDLVRWGKAIYRIVWNDDEGIAQLKYIKGNEVFATLRITQLRKGVIISNVWENPELLEVN